jgi:hypothetical protein
MIYTHVLAPNAKPLGVIMLMEQPVQSRKLRKKCFFCNYLTYHLKGGVMSFFKHIAVLSAIAGIALFQQAAAQYDVNVPYNEVTVENEEGRAVFNGPGGVGFTTVPGEPRLPFEIVTILLPPEVNFEDVTVQLVNPFYEVPGGTFDVAPAPGAWPDSTKIIDGKDTSIYRNDAFFPADFKGDVWFDQLYHYKMVCIKVYPYLYNPVRNKLRKLTSGIIEVSFATDTAPAAVLNKQPIAGAVNDLSKIAANPEALAMYGTTQAQLQLMATSTAAPLARTKYAIITTNAIYTGSQTPAIDDDIDDYKDHLESEGYTVTLVTEGASEGPNTWENAALAKDRAINIRKWLQDYVNTDSPEEWYVLLIGNPNPLDLVGVPGDVPMVLM